MLILNPYMTGPTQRYRRGYLMHENHFQLCTAFCFAARRYNLINQDFLSLRLRSTLLKCAKGYKNVYDLPSQLEQDSVLITSPIKMIR